jgi:DNA-binding response OmpR family regulator
MKKRVLVVENDRAILALIEILLEEAGYELRMFSNDQNIFNNIVEFKPDIVILDILQPTLAGTELCRQLKAAKTTCHIPIVALSTHPKIEKVKEICADEIVPKPFDIDGLLDILAEQLADAD